MLAHVRDLEVLLLRALKKAGAQVDASLLVVPDETKRGRFMAFRTAHAAEIIQSLAAQKIIVDHRGDRLRIGLGIYSDAHAVKRLAKALVV